MMLKLDSTLDLFVIFIVMIKMVFLFSAVGHIMLTHLPKSIFGKDANVKDAKLVYWKERTEFIFIASMSLLLIYYFRPGHLKPITSESAMLFFLFGWILLITAKWDLFFKEAAWYKNISNALQ